MKHNKFPQDQNQMPAGVTQPSAADLSRNAIDFVPLPDEVARKAYFSYVNQGSLPGCDVQHWLDAEVQLLAERQLNSSPKPQKRDSPISKSRDIRIKSTFSSEDRGAGRMKTVHDPQNLFHICALL
jgi:hypothetical protein